MPPRPSDTAAGTRRPAPRSESGGVKDGRAFRVLVICSGNICRSPIAEHVLRAAVAEAGLADRVVVASAGTGDWHVGSAADRRAVAVLRAAGLTSDHGARMMTAEDLDAADLVLAADRGHLGSIRRMVADPAKVRLLRSFDPDADSDEVPDPYYGPDTGFDDVLAVTMAAVPGILDEIRRRLQ